MAKVKIGGEYFEWDGTKAPMSEALAIEKVYKRRYAEWQAELNAGSAEAFCVLAWTIWRRDGRDVDYDAILSGAVDFDLNEMIQSLRDAREAEEKAQAAADEVAAAGPNPTPAGSGPDGSPGIGTVTPPSSRNGSISAIGKSASSRSKTSKR
jgi:hypothetical protein